MGRDAWNTTISNENIRVVHTPTRFAQGGGSLALSLGLAGAGSVATSGVMGGGTLPLTIGLAGAGTVEVRGAGTLALVAQLAGTGTVGSVPVVGTGALPLVVHLAGAGAVGIAGNGSLALALRLVGAGTAAGLPIFGSGVLALSLTLRGRIGSITGTGWRMKLRSAGYRWRLTWRPMTPLTPFPIPISAANDAGVVVEEVAGYELPSGAPLIYDGSSVTAYWTATPAGTAPIGSISHTFPRNAAPPRFAVAFEATEMSTVLANLPDGSPVWLVLEGANDFRVAIEHVVRSARVLA